MKVIKGSFKEAVETLKRLIGVTIPLKIAATSLSRDTFIAFQ